MKEKRLTELDALRGLAALSVLLFHYTYFYNQSYGHVKEEYLLNFKYGSYGVHLFFMISGFVIYMTLLKTNNTKDFIFKRAVRLYPAYLVAVTLTFMTIVLMGLEGMGVSLRDYLFNLTMFQGVIPGTGIDLVDGSYWSLGIEVTFYIFCVILLSMGLAKRPVLITSLWLLGLFTIKILYVNSLITPIIGDLGIINYSNLFIVGIMFYQLKQSKLIVNYLIIVFALVFQFCFHGVLSGLIICCFVGVFYLLINNKLSFLGTRIFTFLGTISYSLYLIHQSIGYIIIDFIEQFGLINEIFILVPILISIALATVITFGVEKPIQGFLITRYNKGRENELPAKNVSA
ncbi:MULTISPECIES: acyltransferase family protein [Bacillus]|uniref:Peptidoglycan/LPS O-acetylase OafA/YrhL n=2 Tax=Bacillus mycoides TaxID=1405 RepID=A0A3D9UFF1_BACMY|nr:MULTISPECIES: acyltransferase [Bacillus]RBP22008.1 peptidoglycan/LPS O-acetylase OafA/YrhL [Bacillus sp. DB-2]REF24674.1 peptidoglycan/LPS O-acetylase OafA/YrhL [Bacillus mycoides]